MRWVFSPAGAGFSLAPMMMLGFIRVRERVALCLTETSILSRGYCAFSLCHPDGRLFVVVVQQQGMVAHCLRLLLGLAHGPSLSLPLAWLSFSRVH
eukprot:scaffold11820_cov189-Ochromonas_danica.AAC.1